ncbi:hypothetical protein PLICRDRAFT_95627 [Plicaturopsis crispa FD-325 SS-3]|uniref:Uncharacterized protein n=1 Tax=Plicaturopsis crispa FD-325 SS-3 TaxID=944288 RepID=A0A0C9T3P1_PLICR|nr:hypothetical protein PLICRDRAFT_95627 [Plicaturopsis crispa FD-325 SS-3]
MPHDTNNAQQSGRGSGARHKNCSGACPPTTPTIRTTRSFLRRHLECRGNAFTLDTAKGARHTGFASAQRFHLLNGCLLLEARLGETRGLNSDLRAAKYTISPSWSRVITPGLRQVRVPVVLALFDSMQDAMKGKSNNLVVNVYRGYNVVIQIDDEVRDVKTPRAQRKR